MEIVIVSDFARGDRFLVTFNHHTPREITLFVGHGVAEVLDLLHSHQIVLLFNFVSLRLHFPHFLLKFFYHKFHLIDLNEKSITLALNEYSLSDDSFWMVLMRDL